MNLHYLVRVLLGRATCVKHRSARLFPQARIINSGGKSELIRIGASSIIQGELFVFGHGGSISIGDSCFIGPNTRIWSAAHVHIGNRVMISHSVNVFDSLTHPLDHKARARHFDQIAHTGHPTSIDLGERPVHVGDDAWIAAGAIVLRGVTIGAGAIVGAGSVVTSDVPPFAIVAGNPARIIRYLDSSTGEVSPTAPEAGSRRPASDMDPSHPQRPDAPGP